MYQTYQTGQTNQTGQIHQIDMVDQIDDDLIRRKIENAIYITCPLYNSNLITDAYIIGSVAKGTARKESDIDIVIINPKFEFFMDDLSPSEEGKNLKEVVNKLKDMGAEFKILKKEKEFIHTFWHQLYRNEIFHIIPQKFFVNHLPHIQITEDLCK